MIQRHGDEDGSSSCADGLAGADMLKGIAIVIFILLAVWSAHLVLASRMSPEAHDRALCYLAGHPDEIPNRRYVTVIDFTKPSYVKRMFICDLQNGRRDAYLVAHGKNSGAVYATRFSNEIGSQRSPRGFFLTGQAYQGDHGPALRLHGLEPGVNDNAYRRDIVLHGASWVSYGAIVENGGRLGRSWGCPAVSSSAVAEVVDRLKDGSLLYIHAPPRWAGAQRG